MNKSGRVTGYELRELITNCAESIPSSVDGNRLTLAWAEVQVRPAIRAQTFAILTALYVRRHGENPRLPHRRSEIYRRSERIECVHIGIVGTFLVVGREDEVLILVDSNLDVL
jgi:hypothetical protein